MLKNQDLFASVVRATTAAEEKALLQFCEQSGPVDRMLPLFCSKGSMNRSFLVCFKKESSAYKLKWRSRTVKLREQPILVDILRDSPALQERYGRLLQRTKPTAHGSNRLHKSLVDALDEENIGRSSPGRPLSAPGSRIFASFSPTGRLSIQNRTSKTKPSISLPLLGLNLSRDQMKSGSNKSVSFQLSSSFESPSSIAGGSPSPMSRSTTMLRQSSRETSVIRASHSPTGSPYASFDHSTPTGHTQAMLSSHSSALSRKVSASSVPYGSAIVLTKSALRRDVKDAKEHYRFALERVKQKLSLIEKKQAFTQFLELSDGRIKFGGN